MKKEIQKFNDSLIAYKQRETYIATINHDLKIPALAQIRALELVSNESLGNLNTEQKEIINLTLSSCKTMYDMLSTILSTYKYENKDIFLDFESVEITKILSDCIINNESNKGKKIKSKLLSDKKTFNIFADRIQIKKALNNLIKFCFFSASKNSNLICKIKRLKKNIYISICFNNPFISKEKLENMFNMYTTSTEKLDKVGSSLELYLARQIILAHKGNISIDCKKSLNTYKIKLPCI